MRMRPVLAAARDNAARAGPRRAHHASKRGRLADAKPAGEGPGEGNGFLATNPPYGVRLEDRETARALMKQFGERLRANFSGWDAAVLAGSPDAGLELGIRAERVHTVWNGALECRLLRLHVSAESRKADAAHRPRGAHRRDARGIARLEDVRQSPRQEHQAAQELGGTRRRHVVTACTTPTCRSTPSPSIVTRESDGERHWLYVQEYAAPKTIEPEAVQRRRNEALAALPGVTGIPVERIHLRQRRRTTRGEQYEKLGESADFKLVAEGGLRFWVNFTDYLDTGLFLDHRITRERLRADAARRRFLNLFAYTGSATVYAAAGGARATHDRRHVSHLPRLGSAQSGSERLFADATMNSSRTIASPGSRPRWPSAAPTT